MIEHEQFWLTAHPYMNDEREYLEGLEILEKHLNARLHDAGDKAVSFTYEIMSFVKQAMFYSTSFSFKSDLLSQWRSYCPSDGGVSIGFDREILEASICGRSDNHNFRYIQECCYDPQHSDYVADTIAQAAAKHLQEYGDEPSRGMGLRHNLFLEVIGLLARSKNSSFDEEQEVRLFTFGHRELSTIEVEDKSIPKMYNNPAWAFIRDEQVSFRAKSNFLVPFLKIYFPVQAIKEIMIGPCRYQSLAEESIKLFLRSKGLFDNIEVKKTSTPYRAI